VPRNERYDSAEKLDPADRIEHRLSTEPIDPIESADPMEPIDRTDPVEAIESTEPVEAIERNERSERQDRAISACLGEGEDGRVGLDLAVAADELDPAVFSLTKAG